MLLVMNISVFLLEDNCIQLFLDTSSTLEQPLAGKVWIGADGKKSPSKSQSQFHLVEGQKGRLSLRAQLHFRREPNENELR